MKAETVFGVFAVALIVVSLIFFGRGLHSCHEHGGQYVRGTVWYVCVEKTR